jgi:hypothetical protein
MELLDLTLWQGINRLLDNFAKINVGDDIIIVYTLEVREPASWVALACRARGFKAPLVPMIPLRDPGFFNRLNEFIPHDRLAPGRLVIFIFEGETMSHNVVVKKILSGYSPDSYTVVRGINTCRDMFTVGLATPPDELSARNTTLLNRCRIASTLKVESAGGTQLWCKLDNRKYQYKSSRGVRQPGKFMVIPPGEVATFPADISGRLVADFALNVNVHFAGDVRLDKCPVIVDINNGMLANFECNNTEIHEFLHQSFMRANANRVGELGFGTNPAVTSSVIYNSHLNERVPGVHIGFGQHNQDDVVAGYVCDIHIDLCAKGGLIYFDDDPIPLDLEAMTPSRLPHPELISGEDVFSDDAEDDCCGLIR